MLHAGMLVKLKEWKAILACKAKQSVSNMRNIANKQWDFGYKAAKTMRVAH
jgi:hypothetical protein